ncbi:MAG: PCRF domain-containing protein, partial [Thermoanaerobaculia bacterium]|nr:PCRF domain-containing protein [Thermoanaerobaculia bacterium]
MPVPDKLREKLDELDAQHQELSRQLLEPEVLADHRRIRQISIKKAALEKLVGEYRRFCAIEREIDEHRALIDEGGDAELIGLARDELPDLEADAEQLIDSIQKRLLTSEDMAVGSVILEVRAGVGGDEAALFAGDLLQMYERYASEHDWEVEVMHLSPGEHGGVKQAIASITGEGVWANLCYEGGTHQVKR